MPLNVELSRWVQVSPSQSFESPSAQIQVVWLTLRAGISDSSGGGPSNAVVAISAASVLDGHSLAAVRVVGERSPLRDGRQCSRSPARS